MVDCAMLTMPILSQSNEGVGIETMMSLPTSDYTTRIPSRMTVREFLSF